MGLSTHVLPKTICVSSAVAWRYARLSEASLRALATLKPDEFPPMRELVASPRAVW